jgi:hypothetical protein
MNSAMPDIYSHVKLVHNEAESRRYAQQSSIDLTAVYSLSTESLIQFHTGHEWSYFMKMPVDIIMVLLV